MLVEHKIREVETWYGEAESSQHNCPKFQAKVSGWRPGPANELGEDEEAHKRLIGKVEA